MNKTSIIIALFITLPLLFGAATFVTIIAARFSQEGIAKEDTPVIPIQTPPNDPLCGDGICSKAERTSGLCSVDC